MRDRLLDNFCFRWFYRFKRSLHSTDFSEFLKHFKICFYAVYVTLICFVLSTFWFPFIFFSILNINNVLHLLDAVTRGYCKCYLPCMSCSYCFSCTADCNVILTRYCSNVDYSHPVMDEIRIYRDVNVITKPINLYISLCLATLADKKLFASGSGSIELTLWDRCATATPWKSTGRQSAGLRLMRHFTQFTLLRTSSRSSGRCATV